MDNNLLSSNLATGLTSLASSNPLGASPDATSGNSGTAVNTVKGADFANLFAQIMVDSTGQNLAGGLANGAASLANSAAPGTSAAGMPYLPSGLTTIPLGPQLQLVTAAKPLPDGSSLLAFARSQGLDESTVSHLFAEMSQKISTASVLGSSTPMSQSAPGADLQGSALFANLNALPTQIQTSPGLVSIPTDMTQAMQALQTEMTWQMGHPGNIGPAMPISTVSGSAALVAAQIPQASQGSQNDQNSLGGGLALKGVQAGSTLSPASASLTRLESAAPLQQTPLPFSSTSTSTSTISTPLAQLMSFGAPTPGVGKAATDLPEAKVTNPMQDSLDRANLDGLSEGPALPLSPPTLTSPTLSPMPLSPMPLSHANLSGPQPTKVATSTELSSASAAETGLVFGGHNELPPVTSSAMGLLSALPAVPMSPMPLDTLSSTPISMAPLSSQQTVFSSLNANEAQPTDPIGAQSLGSVQSIFNDAQKNDPSMMNTLRLQLQPVQATTQRLAAMVSQNESGSWGNLTGYTQGEGAILDLGLAAPLQGESLNGKASNTAHAGNFNDTLSALTSLGNTTSESGAAVAGLSSTQSVNSFGPPEMVKPSFTEQLATSQQNYQQMSEKLGQALASRLQDQIQSGQWKMQMNVVPAHLGKISIDLNMHSGGLDATFKSDNTATRDLIVAGMPTLRHNLNQSGTTVASVWVNADARGQSGGNPTPGQGRQTPPEAKKNPLDKEDESDVSTGASDEAGWSLMA